MGRKEDGTGSVLSWADVWMYMIRNSKVTRSDVSRGAKPERIETQIHRRRTVKALSPLASEWESLSAHPSFSAPVQPAKPK